jgi:hypothetical protein
VIERASNEELGRAAWLALPAAERSKLVAAFAGTPELAGMANALAGALHEHVIRSEPSLASRFSRASGERAADILSLAREIATIVLDRAPGGSELHAGRLEAAYAQQLLALILPLVEPLAPNGTAGLSPEELAGLLARAHDEQSLASSALSVALERVAGELMGAVGEELREKYGQILDRPARRPVGDWTVPPRYLLLSVDLTSVSCARYLAGLFEAGKDAYGFDELRSGQSGRAKRVDEVAVKYEPVESAADPGIAQADETLNSAAAGSAEGSELKAKLFVGLLSLAADEARREDGDVRLIVRLRDLLAMMGYRVGSRTNGAYYRRYRSDLIRFLIRDLPNRVVAMQVSFAHSPEPLVVFERLLLRSIPLDETACPVAGNLVRPADGTDGGGALLPHASRSPAVEGFELVLSRDLLEALGLCGPMSAVEHVPLEVLSLRGPAFWLAWQVSFLRRWANRPASGSHGKPLLRVLQECGYLARFTRGNRVRYKDALRSLWNDVGSLVSMELLEEPGVRLYGPGGAGWRDRSAELSRALDAGGRRLGVEALRDIRVIFAVPSWRTEQLEGARRRGRSSRRGVPGIRPR